MLVRIGPSPRLAVELHGPTAMGTPFVLFLHGIGANRHQWRPQLDALADQFRVAAVDMRGYGESDDDASPLDFASFAADVIRVLDHFGVARVHLVGLSMGGRVARDVALRSPERVQSLVLANTTPGFDALSPEAQDKFVTDRTSAMRSGQTPAEIAPQAAARVLHPNASPAALAATIAIMSTLRPTSYMKTVAASVAQDRAAPIERITAPTLVISSDRDTVYPSALSAQLAARIPGAILVEIPNAGHLSNLEQPAAFNSALRAFISRHGNG